MHINCKHQRDTTIPQFIAQNAATKAVPCSMRLHIVLLLYKFALKATGSHERNQHIAGARLVTRFLCLIHE